MNPENQQQAKKRKINARITALRGDGNEDGKVIDAVLAFPDLSNSMRTKLKSAKASGKEREALDQLAAFTAVGEGDIAAPEKTKGRVGSVANFLGMEKAGRRIGYGLAMLDPQHRRNLQSLSPEQQEQFKTGGVTGKEFAGSLGLTGLNLATGGLAQGAVRALGGKATGGLFRNVAARSLQPSQLAARTVAQSPIRTGALLGGVGGVASGMEQDKDAFGIAGSAVTGASLGAALGMIPGAIKYFNPTTAAKKEAQKAIERIAPDYGNLSATQRKLFTRQGRVTPRTLTKGQKVNLNDNELATAVRNADIIVDDPIQTSLNIRKRTNELDSAVGQFLMQNNGIFNKNEIRAALRRGMDDVVDLSGIGDTQSMNRAKEKLINEFVSELDKNDMYSLWKARKAFDQRIGKAFTGAPNLQKEAKKALRNAVQNFISKKTPDQTYSTYMKDMSSLYNIQELVEISIAKQRAGSVIGEKVSNVTRGLTQIGGVAGGVGAGYLLARGGSGNE